MGLIGWWVYQLSEEHTKGLKWVTDDPYTRITGIKNRITGLETGFYAPIKNTKNVRIV